MATVTVTLHVRTAWWLPFYLSGVRAMSTLTGLEPDWGRVEFWVRRAITVKAIPCR